MREKVFREGKGLKLRDGGGMDDLGNGTVLVVVDAR